MRKTERLALVLALTAGLVACGGGESPETAESEAPASTSEAAAASEANSGYELGEPRDDLERFYGIYGSEDQPGRDFFVAPAKRSPEFEDQIPEGYLMIGAVWGDVAPWYMKSVADNRFEQQWVNPSGETIIAEFETDGGRATALTFETVFDDRGRLERIGDLSDRFQ